MSDVNEVGDQDGVSLQYDTAREEFDRNSEIGEQFFFVKTWPAWFVNAHNKWYSPVIRLYLGDRDGKILLSKAVVLSSLIDLIGEMTDNLAKDTSIAAEMKEYKMFLPFSKDEVMKDLNDILRNIETIKENMDNIEIINQVLD